MKLFYNAQFHTLREEGNIVSAVLVDDQGYIKETYTHTPEIKNVEKIDLKKTLFILDSLILTHIHLKVDYIV